MTRVPPREELLSGNENMCMNTKWLILSIITLVTIVVLLGTFLLGRTVPRQVSTRSQIQSRLSACGVGYTSVSAHVNEDGDMSVCLYGLHGPEGFDFILGEIPDVVACDGDCDEIDISRITKCRKLQLLNVPWAMLRNEHLLAQLSIANLNACIEKPFQSDELRRRAGNWRISLFATSQHLESIIACQDSQNYDLILPRRLFNSMTADQKEALRRMSFRWINGTRPDCFWKTPEFIHGMKGTRWEDVP